ncbi:MAG: helix-turn-helix domain-containing protein [Actinomycetota bacterium]|nr:helix-turn-helix domain-containing protein [Actinomycetota bacterium]
MRSDARRNRERLVAAAAEVIAECGPDASLNEIAQRAGVGAGTLYRHFPTRDELLVAVFTGRIDTLCALAGELVAARDPDEALTAWLDAFLVHCLTDRGLAETISRAGLDSDLDCAAKMRGAAAGLVDGARAAGAVRADVEATDVLELVIGIALAAPDADRAERLLALTRRALRP